MSIERILDKHGIEYGTVGSSFQIRCLSPEHEDKNPSMFVNKFSGWANCRSCGASYNIFELLNEKPNWLQVRKDKFRQLLLQKASESNYLEFPETAVFWKETFKGVSAKTLEKFQAFQCADFPGYICFPIKNTSGKIINFVGRDTTGTRKAKYVHFLKKPVIMYPRDNSHYNSVILVEGLFDMLNLYDKGIKNSRCLFGATNFSNDTLEALKVEGIDEVIIMLDGDTTGKKESLKIKEILDRDFVNNKIVTLPEDADPGELDRATVLKIKESLYGKSSNS